MCRGGFSMWVMVCACRWGKGNSSIGPYYFPVSAVRTSVVVSVFCLILRSSVPWVGQDFCMSAWAWAVQSVCWAGRDKATGPRGGCLCRTTKHLQRTQSFNRNIATSPEIDFKLFLRWGKGWLGLAQPLLFTESVLMDEAVQRVLKFAGDIYLLHCMFFYDGSYSTIQIKKALLNHLIPRKIKSFTGKKKVQQNLDQKTSRYKGFLLLHSCLYYSSPEKKEWLIIQSGSVSSAKEESPERDSWKCWHLTIETDSTSPRQLLALVRVVQ